MRRISNHEIILTIGDKQAFYDLYCATSNRAIDMYVKAGRRKFALKLHGFHLRSLRKTDERKGYFEGHG